MKTMTKLASIVAGGAIFLANPVFAQDSTTLEAVLDKGFLSCGVSQGLPGFSNADDAGAWTGIDVDVCRAVAAAVFGDSEAVRYIPLSNIQRFAALSSGEIDVLSRNSTWTMTRDTQLSLNFLGVNYYDGQGVMVRRETQFTSINDLDGANICTNTGTTTELNIVDYFRSNGMELNLVAFEKADEAVSAYDAGRCDVYTTDHSALAAHRTRLTRPNDHIILPEVISKEPLGPSVRQGDEQWSDIVRWSLFAMINAEELGVSMANVDAMLASENPEIQRLLGVVGNFGQELGLNNDWARNIITQVGNYSDSFERNVGINTPLRIARGVNALWTDGGILYAPPIR